MENEELIETSDFVALGEELKQNKKYLQVSHELFEQGKCRVIMDREEKKPYLVRYYYKNYRPFARITIHNVLRSDIDGLHNHPWSFQTYILSGGYWEETPEGRFWRAPGYHGYSKSTDFHRLSVDPVQSNGEETWTLFLMGPKEKEWGFLNEFGCGEQWTEYLERRKNERQ